MCNSSAVERNKIAYVQYSMCVLCVAKAVRVRRGVPDGLVAGRRGLGLRSHVIRRHDRFYDHRPREPVVLQEPSALWDAAEIRDVSFTSRSSHSLC